MVHSSWSTQRFPLCENLETWPSPLLVSNFGSYSPQTVISAGAGHRERDDLRSGKTLCLNMGEWPAQHGFHCVGNLKTFPLTMPTRSFLNPTQTKIAPIRSGFEPAWLSKPRLRYSPGLTPTTRLNALLNAASDS